MKLREPQPRGGLPAGGAANRGGRAARPSATELKPGGANPQAAFNVVWSTMLAAGLMSMVIVLHYFLGQAQHRIIKVLLGVAAIAIILMNPLFGLFLFPVATQILAAGGSAA